MSAQQPLPPTPPLTSEGFSANTWQRWLEIVRRRLSEAYAPSNPPPEDSVVWASAALAADIDSRLQSLGALVTALPDVSALAADIDSRLQSLIALVATLPDATSAVGQLRQDAALLAADANFSNLSVGLDLTVTGKAGFNGTVPSAATVYPANATDLATAITLVNALKAANVAKGI